MITFVTWYIISSLLWFILHAMYRSFHKHQKSCERMYNFSLYNAHNFSLPIEHQYMSQNTNPYVAGIKTKWLEGSFHWYLSSLLLYDVLLVPFYYLPFLLFIKAFTSITNHMGRCIIWLFDAHNFNLPIEHQNMPQNTKP